MSASRWMSSIAKTLVVGLTISGVAIASATSASADGGRGGGRGDGWHGGRGDGWRGDGWRGNNWRGGYARGWVGGGPRYYGRPYYYGRNRFDAFDAVALGLFGAVVITALSDNQRRYQQEAYVSAMSAPVGQNIVWSDASSNGAVRVTRDGYAGDKYCREFQQSITVNGEQQDAWGIACQEPDGSWRLQSD